MRESLATWLALREQADWTSRDARLLERVAAQRPPGPLHAVDLCTGTGSNLRYLMERLGGVQRWLAIDRDDRLLAELPERVAAWGAARGAETNVRGAVVTVQGPETSVEIEMRQMDLAGLPPTIFDGRHLVTASALLDLVSARWLDTLADRCRSAGAAALFTITYTGASSCVPPEPEDDVVRDLMNRHQKTDKGLGGPAAGPDAAADAVRSFTNAGYHVQASTSDWRLAPGDQEFQRQLIEGWAHAAREVAPGQRAVIDAWLARRLAHVESGRSHVTVGHRDLVAWL